MAASLACHRPAAASTSDCCCLGLDVGCRLLLHLKELCLQAAGEPDLSSLLQAAQLTLGSCLPLDSYTPQQQLLVRQGRGWKLESIRSTQTLQHWLWQPRLQQQLSFVWSAAPAPCKLFSICSTPQR